MNRRVLKIDGTIFQNRGSESIDDVMQEFKVRLQNYGFSFAGKIEKITNQLCYCLETDRDNKLVLKIAEKETFEGNPIRIIFNSDINEMMLELTKKGFKRFDDFSTTMLQFYFPVNINVSEAIENVESFNLIAIK